MPLEQNVLQKLQGTSLFYPCSGNDVMLPIAMFAPHIADFWFVDICYFTSAPENQRPVLSGRRGYELLDKQIRFPSMPEEDWLTDNRYGRKPPPILTETYRHIASGREIKVHRHRRRGPSALRKEISELGVFFYRGDSNNDGTRGSGTFWLTVHRPEKRRRCCLIHEVLDKLVDGGLIVTDGSMCHGRRNPYRELARFRTREDSLRSEAVNLAQPFEDGRGNSLRCVGYCGYNAQYSPTLIWQVTKARQQAKVGTQH